jgi:hypothetical protein
MGRSKHRCLLAIDVVELTGAEIGKLREQYQHDRYLESVLPKYTINTNNEKGGIIESAYFLQFTDEGDKIYTLFDYSTVDRLLQEEISNCGLDDMLKHCDIRPYLEKFSKQNYETFGRNLSSAEYLVIDIEYSGGGYWNEYDVDVDFSVAGVLIGNNLTLIEPVNESSTK